MIEKNLPKSCLSVTLTPDYLQFQEQLTKTKSETRFRFKPLGNH